MTVIKTLLQKYNADSTLLKQITDPPKRTKHATTTFKGSGNYQPGEVHQMDLLFLPEDATGDRYLLVVTDIDSPATDARPLATKNGRAVLNALKDIYEREEYVTLPKIIHVDDGNEFNEVLKWAKTKKIGRRVASVGRHKQQAIVENLNKQIGGTIMKLQLNNELAGGEIEKDWTVYLPDILEAVNKRKFTKVPPRPNVNADVKCVKNECKTYMVGDKVRVLHDFPQNFQGTRLYGDNFRQGDVRWSLRPHIIKNIIMTPGNPIRYVVSDDACGREGLSAKEKKIIEKKCPLRNTFSKYELKPYVQGGVLSKIKPKFTIEKFLREGQETYGKKRRIFLAKFAGYDDEKDNRWYWEEDLPQAGVNEAGKQILIDTLPQPRSKLKFSLGKSQRGKYWDMINKQAELNAQGE